MATVIRKSKWQTPFNPASVQQQEQYQYTERHRFKSSIPNLEHPLQEKGLAFYKNVLFKAIFSPDYFGNKCKYFKT